MQIEDIKLLILDDQTSYLELIKLILMDIGVQHFCLVNNYEEALRAFSDFKPDACFLDIELVRGQKNGVAVATAIRKQDRDIPIVFLTSHFQDDFYKQVRPLRPSGFMNKELSNLKLLQVTELMILQIENNQFKNSITVQKPALTTPRKSKSYRNTTQFFFKIGDTFKAIDITTIDFFFSENKLTYARVGNRNYPTSVQLKVLEEELNPSFLRAHKKFLINIKAIDSIIVKDGKVKIGNELLSIGYAYRKSFLEGLNLLK